MCGLLLICVCGGCAWSANRYRNMIICPVCVGQAFSEGTASTFDCSLKEKPPFTIRNCLGIPLILQHSANLRPVGSSAQGKLHELPVDQSLDLEHSTFEPSSRGKLSALQRQESCLFNLSIGQNTSLSCSLILQRSHLAMHCFVAGLRKYIFVD